MNNFIKKIARILPDDILFGESFGYAKKINGAFKETGNKIDFISSYQTEKLKQIISLAEKTAFYNYLKDAPNEFGKIRFINKEIVANSLGKMIVQKRNADYVTTGGSSGKTL